MPCLSPGSVLGCRGGFGPASPVPSVGVLMLFMGACFFCHWHGERKHTLYAMPLHPMIEVVVGEEGLGYLTVGYMAHVYSQFGVLEVVWGEEVKGYICY